jgi:molybdenum cofactor biosynthesis enzyme
MSMVDVGNKAPTSRFAKARCTVTFPPEVITAFFNNHGSKGPIFETARLAGIMDAKNFGFDTIVSSVAFGSPLMIVDVELLHQLN